MDTYALDSVLHILFLIYVPNLKGISQMTAPGSSVNEVVLGRSKCVQKTCMGSSSEPTQERAVLCMKSLNLA